MTEEIEIVDPIEIESAVATMLHGMTPRTNQELEDYRWKNETLDILKRSGLPARYHYRLTDWGEKSQQGVFATCKARFQGKGSIIAMVGDRGTGKTTIAAQLIIDRAQTDGLMPWQKCGSYSKLPELLARYKSLYADYGSNNTEQLIASLDSFCRRSFAVIDEIHEGDDQKTSERLLTDILDRRYSNMVDTLLISNHTPENFKTAMSDSVKSRIMEHGAIIPCRWNSWRGRKEARHA